MTAALYIGKVKQQVREMWWDQCERDGLLHSDEEHLQTAVDEAVEDSDISTVLELAYQEPGMLSQDLSRLPWPPATCADALCQSLKSYLISELYYLPE